MKCMQLPAELLERIVTAAVYCGRPVLRLQDRARCLAVCKLWREALSFQRIPVHRLDLRPRQGFTDPVTEWVCRNQPRVQTVYISVDGELAFQAPPLQAAYRALLSLHPREALKELTLSMPLSAIQPLWPAVSLFTCLRHLEVRLLKKFGTLDGSWLSSLPPSLEALDLKSLNKVVIPSIGGLLPSLTYLMVGDTGELVIDAVLPSLELLETEEVEITQLAGPRLQLPQLTRLDICSARGSGVDLQRMPSLQVIELWGCPPMAAPGLAALSHLTSLGLCLNETKDAGLALGLLQRVPAQLRHLQLLTCEFLVPDVDEPASQLLPALRRLTQLTSLSTDSTALLPYLAALPRLRCLELQHMSAGQLSIQDADFLAGLRGLQQLTFRGMMPIGEERTRRLQLLAYILPAGCVIHQPTRHSHLRPVS